MPRAESGASRRLRIDAAARSDPAPAVTPRHPQGLAAPLEGRADDLKLIKGVGPVLEKMLHQAGVLPFRADRGLGPGGRRLVRAEPRGVQGPRRARGLGRAGAASWRRRATRRTRTSRSSRNERRRPGVLRMAERSSHARTRCSGRFSGGWRRWSPRSVVFGVHVASIVKDDPAAGIVFGGVTFVIVGLLLVYLGPGPKPSDAVAHPTSWHAHGAGARGSRRRRRRSRRRWRRRCAARRRPRRAAPMPAPGPERADQRAGARRGAGGRRGGAGGAGRGCARRWRRCGRRRWRRRRRAAADDLKKIKGVGPKLEELLHSLGIYHFGQIAGWGPAEVAWIDSNLEGFSGRVTRDDWVGQAKLLAARRRDRVLAAGRPGRGLLTGRARPEG